MDRQWGQWLGFGALLIMVPACGSHCRDDGFNWTQSKEACGDTTASGSGTTTGETTTTSTMSGGTETTTTAGNSQSGTESTGLVTEWCRDADGDGQGDPNDCIPATGDEPPDGYVPNADDCDDSDPYTYTGAAYNEDPEACMTDVDGDGWGEPNPKSGVTPGTDCDDNNPFAYPGAAYNEDPVACMEDKDGDGWGELMPGPGIVPGTDCDDNNPFAYPGAAYNEDLEACMEDKDGDGFGNANPGPGILPGTDCDDESEHTYPGAAPNDDPEACMKDEDGDGWGDMNPPEGVTPGTDCDDTNEFTYPGAAYNEEPPDACMRDVDGDGWGDDSPPEGVTPGMDCNDTDPSIYQGCADCEPEQLFCQEEDLYLCNANGTGAKIEETCEFGCDAENGVCFAELTVEAGPSLCIDPGQSVQLQAMAMGGDGNYAWDWTPANSLNNPNIANPLATPPAQTTYTVEVTDGNNQTASDSVSVFIKDTPLPLDNTCGIVNFAWDLWGGSHAAANWSWNANTQELCQTNNSRPSARFCGWSLDNATVRGRFGVKSASDDDYIGMIWGLQPFDLMSEDPKEFYFLGWKQVNQLGFCNGNGPNVSPQSGRRGIIVKRISVDDPENNPLGCMDFHDPNDTTNSVTLATEAEIYDLGWGNNTMYIFELTHTPQDFTVRIIRENDNQLLVEKTFEDSTYPNGQVGFYAYSQVQTCFGQFTTSCL